MKSRIFFVFLLVFIIGCTTTSNVVLEPTLKEELELEVYFCPRDNCTEILYNILNQAQYSISCAFYDLDSTSIIDLLDQKKHITDVRIITDNDNFHMTKNEYCEKSSHGAGEAYAERGQSTALADSCQGWLDFEQIIKHDNRSGLMHQKFCILDNKTVITGSMNPTFNGMNKNNNNLLTIKSKPLAKTYTDEFNEMWKGTFGKGVKTDNPNIENDKTKITTYFCPEDSCSEKLRSELKKANKSIYFMTFTFTDHRIATELLQKHYEGVHVKGIYEKRSITRYSTYHKLLHQNITVIKDSNPAVMHHKVFIIDNTTIITGSYNPTKSADTKNDENLLIVQNQDLVHQYLNEFENIQ